MKEWRGVSQWDYKDRRIARMNALGNALEFCKMHNLKPTLSELFQIADKMLAYIYRDDPDPDNVLKELDEKLGGLPENPPF